jgi:hypothetical protein
LPDLVFSSNFFEPFKSTSKGIFTTDADKPVAFTGVGHTLDPNN